MECKLEIRSFFCKKKDYEDEDNSDLENLLVTHSPQVLHGEISATTTRWSSGI